MYRTCLLSFRSIGRSQSGYVVAQLVEALRYKTESRGFDFQWGHWDFSLTESFRPRCGHGVDSVSNRNEYQGYCLGVKDGRCAELKKNLTL